MRCLTNLINSAIKEKTLPQTYRVIVALVVAFAIAFSVYTYIAPKSQSVKPSLLVYAPPVIQPLLEAAVKDYERVHGVKVGVVYGATGTLIYRIGLTREGDVLITADHSFMLKAMKQDLVYNETVKVVTYSIPALVVPRGNPANVTSLQDLVKGSVKIGIADPQVAPYGRMAVETLEKNGVYEMVESRLVVFRDVGEAARQVALGLVDVAILPHVMHYAYINSTEVVWLKPSELSSITCQMAAVLKFAKKTDLALDFVEYLVKYARESLNAARLGYVADLPELPKRTPYQPHELVFERACAGALR